MMVRRVLAVALAGLALAGAGCIRITEGGVPGSGSTTATPAASGADVTRGQVTEKLTHGNWAVTVEEAHRTTDKVGGAKPAAGKEFLVVTVGFENTGTDALQVTQSAFALTSEDGAKQPLASIPKAAFNANSVRPITARMGTATVFVFEVPPGSERYVFSFAPEGAEKSARLSWAVP